MPSTRIAAGAASIRHAVTLVATVLALVAVPSTAAAATDPAFLGAIGTDSGPGIQRGASVAVDSSGNTYVIDNDNRIVVMNPAGQLVKVLGMPIYPGRGTTIAVAPDGSLYITDFPFARVYHLDANGNLLAIVGGQGTGDGTYDHPQGVAVDASGNVYVSDQTRNVITEWDPSGHFVAKWGSEGTGNGQFSGISGIAVDPDGSHIYAAEQAGSRIQKIDRAGNTVWKTGSQGSGDGQFTGLINIAVGADGSVYTQEFNGARVQKFDSAGHFVTKNASVGQIPQSIATGPGNTVDILDNATGTVGRYDSSLVKQDTIGYARHSKPEELFAPFDAESDAAGNVVVGDQSKRGFSRYKADGTFISFTALNPTQAVAVAPDGSFWVGGQAFINHYDAAGNQTAHLTSSTDPAYRYNAVVGLAIGPNGSIYVASLGHIIQLAADGTPITAFGDGQFAAIAGLAVAPNGDLFAADVSTSQVSHYTATGTLVNKFGGPGTADGQFVNPRGVGVDADGNVLVADSVGHRVERFTPSGAYLGKFGTPGYAGGGMQQPYSISTDPNGDLLVADFTASNVQRYKASAGLTATSTALTSDHAAGSTYGDSVSFTATITGATDTGTVAFQEQSGSSWITVAGCSAVPVGGIAGNAATCSTAGLPAGTHRLRAAFKASGYSPSTSDAIDQQVARAVVHVDANPSAKVYGDSVPAAAGALRTADLKNSDTLASAGITGAPVCSTDDARDAGVHGGAVTCAAGDLAAANYSFAPGDAADLTVAPAPLHVDAEPASATYGDGDPAAHGHVRAGDLKYGDSVAGDAACTIAAHPAGAATYTGAITCAPGTLAVANYALVTGDAADLTIDRAPLTVSAADAAATYGDGLPAFGAGYDGFKNGDVAGDLGGTLAFDTDAGATPDAGHYAVTPRGLSSNDYDITYAAGTLTVGKAALTVSAGDAHATYGDDLPAFGASYDGFKNGDDAADLDGALALTSDAGDHPAAGHYAIAASGLDARNYAIAYAPGDLTVERAPLTVTAGDASTTYGDDLPAFTAQFDGLENGDHGGDVQFDVDGRDAGRHAITPSGLAAPNYDVAYRPGTLTVARRSLTATAGDATRAYGEDNPHLTGTVTGALGADHIGVTYSTGAATRSDVGDYAIAAQVDDPDGRLGNYDVSTHDGILTVTKAALHARGDDATQVYGGAPAELTGTLAGVVPGDDISATWSADYGDAGDHPIAAQLADPDGRLGNYTVDTTGTLTITRAPLTVTGAAQSRVYGDANPALTGTIAGIVAGDDVTATWSTGATPRSGTGDYATHVDLGGAALRNYDATVNAGKLTVTKRPLTAVANDVTRPYGEDNPTLGGTLLGVANDDAVTARYTTAATRASRPGHYPIDAAVTGTDAVLANYAITTRAGDLTVVDTHGPTLTVPGPIKAEATGSDGARVTYTVSAIDDTVDHPAVTCTPASGSTFAIGTTTVTCQASDGVNTTTDTFTVTVADTTAPVLTLPAGPVVDATDSSGAVVTYAASARDAIEGSVPVTCAPASGTKFAVGTTTVTCTAKDSRGNTARGTFAVQVKSASWQLDDLIKAIDKSSLPAAVKSILKANIVAVQRYIADGKLHQQCQGIDAAISYLETAKRNHQMSSQVADPLLQVLRQVRVVAAC